MKLHEIIFATANLNKAAEVQRLLGDSVRLLNLNDVGIKEDIPETGTTLQQNAALKAQYVFEKTGLPCFADDTGLIVDSLNGEPGVYSARYAGEPKNDMNNMKFLLQKLNTYTNRKAKFVTCICYINTKGEQQFFTGELDGTITHEPAGNGGFGYDPVFMPEGYEITLAQMTMDEKNIISHRAKAFKFLVGYLAGN
jgi:XTP/dITP diphosphohydrolase